MADYQSSYTGAQVDEILGSVSGKESAANKVTSISSSSTDQQYPSAKCVYDLVGNISTVLDNINGEVI